MREPLRCDEAQVWLERARHEALGAEEMLQLEQHVASCAACQSWRASIGQVEVALAARAAQALETVAWPRVDQVLRSRRWRFNASFLFATAGLVLMNVGLVALVGLEHLEAADLLQGLVPELALVLSAWAGARWLDRRERAALEAGETLTALRSGLADELRSLRLSRWLALGVGGFLAVVACWPTHSVRAHVVLAGFTLVPLFGFALLQWSLLPRALREQADLTGQGP
ncbi:MAG: hypothetical protein INH41_00900 [Myxococcaceae bacterium]|jgi:hypothetical protein|nr:hypothetical protein [Myxococcaceae bacterium]